MHPTLASELLYLRYHGQDTVHTVEFDNAGGTAAGLLTITDDDGANAFDLGIVAYDTLSELVAGIEAISDDWEVIPHIGLDKALGLTTANLATRPVSSVASISVVRGNKSTVAIPFTNDYEILAATATTTLVSCKAIEVMQYDQITLSFNILGADALAAGDLDVNVFANNPTRAAKAGDVRMQTMREALDEDEWTTLPIDDEQISFAINGNTRVRYIQTLDVRGLSFLKLGSVVNADDDVVQFQGSYEVDMVAPFA